MTEKEKIVILGIDAATWDIIDPLLDQGKMPTLRSMIEEGVRYRLRTIQPMISPMIWTSIATGKLPEKHGVKDFVATSHSVKAKRIWDILEDSGYSVGLMEVMVTWPPRRVKGFWIPDTFARDAKTYPESLSFIKELISAEKAGSVSMKKRISYALKLWRNGIPPGKLLLSGTHLLKSRVIRGTFEERFYLFRKWRAWIITYLFSHLFRTFSPDFAFFYTNLIDAISHSFWKYHEPEKFSNLDPKKLRRYSKVIPSTYVEVDKMLEVLTRNFDKNTWLILISDHGFRAVQDDPTWISYRINTRKLLEITGLKEEVIPTHVGSTLFLRKLKQSPLIDKDIKKRILSIRFSERNSVFSVEKDEKGYFRVTVPENIIENFGGDCYLPGGEMIPLENLVERAESVVSGTHDEFGVLVMRGPGLRKGEKFSEASVLDITPTILYIAGLPIGEDMDGKVLLEAFSPEFLGEREISYVKSYDLAPRETVEETMTPELEEHLRGLGYL